MKKFKIALWIAAGIIVLLLVGFFYATFIRPSYGGTSNTNLIGFMVFGLLIGGLIAFLIFKLSSKSGNSSITKTSSHTVVESMKRVFKIVVAEGQLNEIYNYENTKKLLKFIPSTKKALVIVRAKVLVGYDIEKCKWEVDEENKKINLISFPKPELLSMEPDFNYYYFEDDLFNLIGRKDLHDIQGLAKEQVKKAALQSGLIKIAADQMKLLLTEIAQANNWQIENTSLIDDYAYLPEPEETAQEDIERVESSPSLKKIILDKATKMLNW